MTPPKNTPSCLARFGALGLAAATVVTGLTLSPVLPALADPAPAVTKEAPADEPESDTPGNDASETTTSEVDASAEPAPPATGAPGDAAPSTSAEVAAIAAPTITRSTSYTDAAGQTVYRYEGTGVAGATVQHGPSRASWQDGPTVGTDGTFVLETTRIPVGDQ